MTPPRTREPAPSVVEEPITTAPKRQWPTVDPKKSQKPQATPEPVAPLAAPSPEFMQSWLSWNRKQR